MEFQDLFDDLRGDWNYQAGFTNPDLGGMVPTTAQQSASTALDQLHNQSDSNPPGLPYIIEEEAPLDLMVLDQPSSSVACVGQEANGSQDPPRGEVATKSARRSRYGSLEWDRHKETLKRVYLDENKSLTETMNIMKSEHSFEASAKLYKQQFKRWDWNKNLPTHVAAYMVSAAEKRRREHGKDTIFLYGGKEWDKGRVESTVIRSKRPRDQQEPTDTQIPEGVRCMTPEGRASSPTQNCNENVDVEDVDETDNSDSRSEAIHEENCIELPLTWNGISRAQVLAFRQEGKALLLQGNLLRAEELLEKAWAGLAHFNGPTNEDTTKVAYELANLHSQKGSTEASNKILEQLTEACIDTWGLEHKRTQQHVLQTVELLDAWNRPKDALGLLSRSEEMLQINSNRSRRRNRNRIRKRKNSQQLMETIAESSQAMGGDSISGDTTITGIDYHLDTAQSRIAAKDYAVETILREILRHCESSPEKLHLQHLRARANLVRLYGNAGAVEEHKAFFNETDAKLLKIWEDCDWDETRFQSFEIMEAFLQVIANMLKCGHAAFARRYFLRVAKKAEDVFGYADERAVSININIGLVYQNYLTWEEAEEWFDRAYSGALAAKWGSNDGIVRSLEDARRKRYFSYLSDEARPFKSIFGVTGITIRPGRLVLD